jgi:hypothetical protein
MSKRYLGWRENISTGQLILFRSYGETMNVFLVMSKSFLAHRNQQAPERPFHFHHDEVNVKITLIFQGDWFQERRYRVILQIN